MNNDVVPFNKNIDRNNFESGKGQLDDYFKKYVSQDTKKKLTVCFVKVNDELEPEGYYTLANDSLPKELVPENIRKKIPYDKISVTLLGRLAIDKNFQGKGLGKKLLMDALFRSYQTSHTIASLAVIVDPIDLEAERFYLKYGFMKLESGKMFLPMATIRKLFS